MDQMTLALNLDRVLLAYRRKDDPKFRDLAIMIMDNAEKIIDEFYAVPNTDGQPDR